MTIASTILDQLGGKQFQIMTGAHGLLDVGNGLQLSFKGNRKINKLIIKLTDNDTYTVEFGFFNHKTLDYNSVSKHEGVYFDQLQSLFTSVTGLYTKL